MNKITTYRYTFCSEGCSSLLYPVGHLQSDRKETIQYIHISYLLGCIGCLPMPYQHIIILRYPDANIKYIQLFDNLTT